MKNAYDLHVVCLHSINNLTAFGIPIIMHHFRALHEVVLA